MISHQQDVSFLPLNYMPSKLKEAQEKIKEAANIPPVQPQAVNPSSPKVHQSSATFNPADYVASDLFSDSSNLPKTSKVDADKQIQSISEKRETLRLVSANLQLNSDVYKAGSLSEKMTQSSITWQTDRIGTENKLVGLEIANTNLQIAQTKLYQTQEKLNHQNIELEGLKAETPLRQQYWQAKLSLAESRIQQIELAKFTIDSRIASIESEAEVIE
jgi:hypothetical protein